MKKEDAIIKMSKDVKKAAATLSDDEARYLVDSYYQMQNFRITTNNQIRAQKDEPHETLEHFAQVYAQAENDMKKALEVYAKSKEIGKWLLSITGIGPVIAAGLIAHIDITKVQSAGQIQRFAGLDPTSKWEKGKKRPFNAKLKVLCWKIGKSFLKSMNRDSDMYGHIIKERKEYELAKNEAGDYAEFAKLQLSLKNFGKATEARKAYEAGKLPLGHIQARAERFAVKIFISHLFEVWYTMEHGERPAEPYAFAILGHAHKIPAPHYDFENKGIDELL